MHKDNWIDIGNIVDEINKILNDLKELDMEESKLNKAVLDTFNSVIEDTTESTI